MNQLDAEAELNRLREAIDRVDEVLVKLLNQRAKYAVEIGEIKGHLSLPIYAPEREKEVLQHVERTSAGPLHDAAIDRDIALATSLGFQGTPAFVVGSYALTGARGLRHFERLVALSLESQQAAPPAPPASAPAKK